MLAAVYHPGNDNLVLEKNYPIRELQDHEVLLKVAACGVCHTDVTILSGVGLDTRQYVLGHEASGVPVKLGPKVNASTVQLGKLYSVLIYDGCMKSGVTPPVATVPAVIGVGKDGAYAQYVITDAASLVPVPDGVPAEVAAIASDAGVTAYHAVENAAKVKKGDKVLIFGIGGLGHLGLQYAKHFGATGMNSDIPHGFKFNSLFDFTVYACDFKPAARKLALELGAAEAFDLIELQTKTAAGFTVDTTIDFIANSQSECSIRLISGDLRPIVAFNLAMAALRGNEINFPASPSLVLVGFSADNLVFNTADVLSTGVQIRGSTYGPASALVSVLDLFAKGIVKAHVESAPLEDANKVIDELRSFEIVGRKVLIPHNH
ncbi:chaperonin 10-like protein [Mycena leptocephala]|nr:chaperonin 10-like protein [Mycena leptocephala]